MKPTNTPAGFADMFATVDAAAAVESAFAALDTALSTEATVLNTAGGEAFQRRLTVEARKYLNAAGASAKLRERIRRLRAERAPAVAVPEKSLAPFSIGSAPVPRAVSQKDASRVASTVVPAGRLTVPRAALLAAALPVLRTRKARRSGKISVTFADGHVAFDCGDAAFTAPATGDWAGAAVVPAKVVFAWLLDPPDRVDPIELRIAEGNFHFHHTRTACHWKPARR